MTSVAADLDPVTAGPSPEERWWRSSWAGSVFLALVLATMLVAVFQRNGYTANPGAGLLIFTVQSWLPLLVRKRWPMAVLVAVVTIEGLHLILVPFIDPGVGTPIWVAAYQPVPVATCAAVWTVASRRPRAQGWIAGGTAATVLLVVSLFARPFSLIATDMVMFDLVIIAAGFGVLATTRRERALRSARELVIETRKQVVAERMRIARDLHDVLAHHLTLVNAQAGVADYLLRNDPPAAATALQDISRHTRRALDELRATVGLLRQEDTSAGGSGASGTQGPELHDATADRYPLPGLDRMPELLAGFRSAGTLIEVTVTGDPVPLVASGDLAAYRILQEALTNATKHAPGALVQVALTWTPAQLELRIVNAPGGRRNRGHRGPGTGHGLIGMRERALATGGQLITRIPPAGGFEVEAAIPVEPEPA